MNVSCSTNKDVTLQAPVSGNVTIPAGGIKSGMYTKTIATADINCKGTGVQAGQTCKQYGAGGSGNGVVVQRTSARDGGTSGLPYTQEILTITGAL